VLDLGRSHSNTRANGSRTSILVVDDEYDIIDLIKQSFEIDGQRVCAFTSPDVALKHFSSNAKDPHSVVISDIRMPCMNGYEFVKQVKKINPKVKVILMSAFEIEPNEFSNILPDVKIDDFLQKPFSLKALKSIVQENIILL
jgi:DNA-binding NtrC family response regulator